MKNRLLILALLVISTAPALLHASPAVMTNQTIQAMLSTGVPLPAIIKAIKTAPKIDLYINERELKELKNAGASAGDTDQIFEAIHYREYVGIDSSLVEPEERAEAPGPLPAVSEPNFPPPPPAGVPSIPASFASAVPAKQPAAPGMLTDAEVTEAILMGMAIGQRRIGLMLSDPETPGDSGYTIHMYTAKQWIEQLVANARSENLPFSAAEVTPEMRRKMLHVVAMPSTPDVMNGNGFALASSVHRILLTDTARSVIVQPVQLNKGKVTANSAFRSAESSNASAAFMMSDVDRLRASDSKGEFFIIVTGVGKDKSFRVKERFGPTTI